MKHLTFWIALFHRPPLQKTCILFRIYYTKGCIDYSWKKADAMEFQMKLKQFAFDERSESMKAPVGLLSDRTVLRSKMEGPRPDKFAFIKVNI